MTRQNWFIIGAVFIFLMLALWIVGTVRAGSNTARAVTTPIATALTEANVTAKGSIVPLRYARLSFGVNGTVAQLLVKEGDKVKAGDVLAQLDPADLKLQAQNAQDAIDIATATLAQAKTPATPDEVSVAEANYRAAQANYDRVKNGVTSSELTILQSTLSKAEAALQLAQAAYDRVGGSSNPMIAMLPQSLALQQATSDYQIAKANFDIKVKTDAPTLASAEAALISSRVALDTKKNGARATDLAVLDARIKQARTVLAQAQATLAKATLVAPFDGTVTSVSLRPGETINAGAVALTIADLSQWRVETSDMDEWGAARVRVGQSVKVSVNAFASKVLTGKVTNIASQSVTLSTGDISYVVTIALDQVDPDVRWGMTVKVEFQKQ